MDKKMRAVSREIRKGEREIKKAVKQNDKLARYDQKVRDPAIEKAKKKGIKVAESPKLPKNFGKTR